MVYGLMAEYEIRISGVHYAANGDSVAGQKDTEEMHMRTRELLSWIDRTRPIITLSPDPKNRVHENALQARALGNRIGRVALECVDLVWDLLRASGKPMLLAKVKEWPPINVLVHYLKNIYLFSVENGLMEKHAEDLDSMDLPFNWRYIPIDYPQPEEYWPVKFEKKM